MPADAYKRLLKALGFDENGNTLGGSSSSSKKRAGGAEASPSGKKAKTLMSFGFKKAPAKETADETPKESGKQVSSQETS